MNISPCLLTFFALVAIAEPAIDWDDIIDLYYEAKRLRSEDNNDVDDNDSRQQEKPYDNEFTATEASPANIEFSHNSDPYERFECDPLSPYRTADGKCNNVRHPRWGAAGECYERFRPTHYLGSDRFRLAVSGHPLPTARRVSLKIFQDVPRPSRLLSFMFTVFGQFVAHDTTMAPPYNPRGCCKEEEEQGFSDHCISYYIDPDDPFYAQYGVTCIDLSRTEPCLRRIDGKREQVNGQSSFLDASIVYGPTAKKMRKLRALDGTGKLKTMLASDGGEIFMPGKVYDDILCSVKASTCFQNGDPRVNQHAFLTSIELLILREHNRLATELKQLNPHWDEEILFQEARRILGAELQSITYQEYLPILLSKRYMDRFDLALAEEGSTYDPEEDPRARNEYGTAAFRIHSMTPSHIGMQGMTFKDTYTNPDMVRGGMTETLLKKSCDVPSQIFSRFYTGDVTNHMYRNRSVPYGKDNAAQDIMRGRDHGLAPYVDYLDLCSPGGKKIKSFEQLRKVMSEKNMQLLKSVYDHVEDVDLVVGMQLEHLLPDSELSPTSACMVAQQLSRIKHGDRLFFDNIDLPTSFTDAQRESLRAITLSRLLCNNASKKISHIQKNALLLPSARNLVVSCQKIPELDLSLWKQSKSRRQTEKSKSNLYPAQMIEKYK